MATSSAPTATLTNSGGAAGDNFGYSVALSADGTTSLVGAYGVSSFTGSAYLFSLVPSVTTVSPSSGPVGGGTPVTVTGTGFTGASAVYFGTAQGTGLAVSSAASLTVTSPAGTGTVDVTVVTPGGTSAISAADHFGYIAPPPPVPLPPPLPAPSPAPVAAPTVSLVSPSTGPATGRTSVTLTGTGFAGASAVYFGTAQGTGLAVSSAASLTVTSPAGTGTVDVTVVTPGGRSTISAADHFSYIPASPPPSTFVRPGYIIATPPAR